MRLVLTFILFMCFHLLGDNTNVHANPVHTIGSVFNSSQKQSVNSFLTDSQTLQTDKKQSGANAYVDVLVDDDDDEINRKTLLTATFLKAFYYAFVSSYNNSIKGIFPVEEHPFYATTPIYISQRVLRIWSLHFPQLPDCIANSFCNAL